MKNKKKSKYKINYLLIFCGCVLFCALSFCGEKEEAARAAEAKEPKASEESGETILKISETAGTPGANGAVLTEVRYDESMYMDMLVKFVFSDGKVVEWKSKYSPYTVKAVECLDLTGDGVKEVLLWGYFTNTAGEYNMLNIFQIEGGEVKEMLFWDDIEELRDKVCHTNLFYTGRGGRQGYALQIETWGKEGACVFLEQEMEIYYEGGRWRKLPGRNIKPQVSLESHREEARLYEAFLRGECRGEESESYRYAAVYCHLALIDFCFQDVLDSVLADSRRTFETETSLRTESVECRLADCAESVEYGLIDCGNDGKPELALLIRGVHNYSINADCDVILIFGCRDGKVELLYMGDTWEGRHAEIFLDGSIYVEGTGGIVWYPNNERVFSGRYVRAEDERAAYYGAEAGKIGADGVYRELYAVTTGTGKEVGSMVAYRPLHKEELLAEFYQCLIGDKTIYAYRIFEDTPGDVLEHTLGYIEENEEQLGKKFFSYETMLALCDAQERKLGIADHDSKENKVRWHKLQGCEEYTVDYRHTSFCSSSAMEIVCSNTVLMELILSI